MNTLYKVTLQDGRIFRVNCANRNQYNRFMRVYNKLKKSMLLDVVTLENGIHTVKQWEEIADTL